MAFCVKYDKYYETQDEYDEHFARWKQRDGQIEFQNRKAAPGEQKLRLNQYADLSDEEIAALTK